MSTSDIIKKTEDLIDALRATCGNNGLSGDGNEYKIVVQMFLYKFLNDKFGYELKHIQNEEYRSRFNEAAHWESAYTSMTDEEREDVWDYLPADTPKLKPEHLIANLYNRMNEGDFSSVFDNTMVSLGQLNADKFSVKTSGKSSVALLESLTNYVTDPDKRDDFARALINNLTTFNFEDIFHQKYDFFSTVFEYLVSDYNKDSGKYGEYFTPHAVATIMARLLVSPDETIHSAATCDPTAGTGTLVMALAHQIGESNCSIFTQDQSQKSTTMLRLNLILNNLVSSLPNVIQGDSLIDWGHERKDGTFDKMFDYVVSNPPFKEDFSQTVTNAAFKNTDRFFAGIPNVPKGDKQKMEIYLVFIQHILYILKDTGKAAVVVPTGFLTASAKIPLAIRKKMVDKGWLRGVVSMPSNIFANTGTNVSVVFIDKGKKDDKVILIDASKLGTTEKVDKNQRTVLNAADEDKIVNTFRSMEDVDDFSKVVSLDEIKEKKYSFSAGQYFDIKIDYVDITEEEFNRRMSEYKSTLAKQFEESHKLEEEIMKQLASLKFNEDVKEE